jgi:2-polyprenyl-6-methoxyphenol hydroxylase-like FAD-dependent oxidoreductase
MSGLNVLVVGASIAGPAAAYWLVRSSISCYVVVGSPSDKRSSAIAVHTF